MLGVAQARPLTLQFRLNQYNRTNGQSFGLGQHHPSRGSTAEKRESVMTPFLFPEMRVNNWIVHTAFWFGRKESLISYNHNITSEDTITHPDDPRIYGPALALARGLCWTGLTPIQWVYLRPEDVEPACASVVDLCGRFFNVLPELLDGLDRQKISDASERDGRS